MKLYLAAPLFTVAERQFNAALAYHLERHGHDVWLPQENEPREKMAAAIFKNDVAGIDWCDCVVGNMDGPDPDSGTAWECGYAWARKKRIVLFRTDFRGIGESEKLPFNLMLTESSDAVLSIGADATVAEIARQIDEALQSVAEVSDA